MPILAGQEAAEAPNPRSCVRSAIESREDESYRGLVGVERESGGNIVVKVNPREMARSYLSASTLDFIYQRECAAASLGFWTPRSRLLTELQERVDCQAVRALRDTFGFSTRDLLTVERDLERLEATDWPETLGRIRKVSLKRCLK